MNRLTLIIIFCLMAVSVPAAAQDSFSWNMFFPAINVSSPPAYTRSSSNNIVTDTETGLQWQDYYLRFKQSEADGIAYCEQLSLDDFEDWRFPLFSELQNFFKGVAADPDFDLRYWGSFDNCTASIAIGGYVKTPHGADVYGGSTGDRINFSGGAAARCVR